MTKEPDIGPTEFPFRKFLRRTVDGPVLKWKETIILGALGFGATLILVLTALALRDVEWRRWTGRQEPVLMTSLAPAPAKTADAELVLDISVLSPQALAGKVSFRRRVVYDPPFEPVETNIFKTETQSALLGGIEGPGAVAVCEDDEKALWACGLQARSALYNLIRLGPVACEPFVLMDDRRTPGPGGLVPSRCTARGMNVALELVRAGFARPSGFPDRAMIDAEEEARLAVRGLWRGGWRIVR
jgi:endonuclease YncB( thermonuclease family)